MLNVSSTDKLGNNNLYCTIDNRRVSSKHKKNQLDRYKDKTQETNNINSAQETPLRCETVQLRAKSRAEVPPREWFCHSRPRFYRKVSFPPGEALKEADR